MRASALYYLSSQMWNNPEIHRRRSRLTRDYSKRKSLTTDFFHLGYGCGCETLPPKVEGEREAGRPLFLHTGKEETLLGPDLLYEW